MIGQIHSAGPSSVNNLLAAQQTVNAPNTEASTHADGAQAGNPASTDSVRAIHTEEGSKSADLPRRYIETMHELMRQIVITASTMEHRFTPAHHDQAVTQAVLCEHELKRFEGMVENAVLELAQRKGVSQRTVRFMLATLRRDDVQSEIDPEIQWLAALFADIGEHCWAEDFDSHAEDEGWTNYHGVFGPSIEEAFHDEETNGWVRPVVTGLGALLTGAWLTLNDKLQQFRWAGSGVDYRHGVDYEKHARAAAESKASQSCAETPMQRMLLALYASSGLTQSGPPASLGFDAQATAAQSITPAGVEIPSDGYLSQLTDYLASWQPNDPLRFPSAGAAQIAPDHPARLSASAEASKTFHEKLDAAVAKQLAPEIDESLLGTHFANIKTHDQVVFDFLERTRPTILEQLGLNTNVRLSDIIVLARSPSGDLSGALDEMILRRLKGDQVFDDEKLDLTYHLKHERSASSKPLESRLENGAYFSFGNLAGDCVAELYRHIAEKGEISCQQELLNTDGRQMATYGRLYAQAALQRVDSEYAAGRLSEAGALTLKAVCRVPTGAARLKGDDVMRGSRAYLVRALVTVPGKEGDVSSRERMMPGLMVASRATPESPPEDDEGAVMYAVGAPEPFSEYRLEDIEGALYAYRHSAGTETDFLQGNDIARAMRIRLAQAFPDIDLGREGVTISLALAPSEGHIFQDMTRAAATIMVPTHRYQMTRSKFEAEGIAPSARRAWLSGQTLEEGGRVARYAPPPLSTISPTVGLPPGSSEIRIGRSGARKLRELADMRTESALAGHAPQGKDQWSIGDRRERILDWGQHELTSIRALKGGFVVSAYEAANSGDLSLLAKNMVLLSVGGETSSDGIELSGMDVDAWPSNGAEVGWLDTGTFQSTIMTIRRADDANALIVTYDALDPVTKFREFRDEAALRAWYQEASGDVNKRDALTQRFYSAESERFDGVPMASMARGRPLGEFSINTRAFARGAGPFTELWDRAQALLLTRFDDWPYKEWEQDRDATIMKYFYYPAEMAKNVASRLGEMAAVQTALFDRAALNSRSSMDAAYGPRIAEALFARAEPIVRSLDSGLPIAPGAFDRHNSMRIPLSSDVALSYPGPVLGLPTLADQMDGVEPFMGMVPKNTVMPGLYLSQGRWLAEGQDGHYLQVMFDDEMQGWRLCMDKEVSRDGPRVAQRPNSTAWEVIPFADAEAILPNVDDRTNFHLARACDRLARQLRFNADDSVAEAFSFGNRYDASRPLPRNATLTSYRLAFLKGFNEGVSPDELGDLWEGVQALEAREPLEKFIRLSQRLQSQPGLDSFRAVSWNSRREMSKLAGRGPTTLCLVAARALVDGKLPDAFFVKENVEPGSFEAIARDRQIAGEGHKAVRADLKQLRDSIDAVISVRPDLLSVGEIIDQLRPSRREDAFLVAQTVNHAVLFGARQSSPGTTTFMLYDPEVGVMTAHNRLAFERIVSSYLLNGGQAVHAYGAQTRRDGKVAFQVADVDVTELMRLD
ncbi:hypothetical protein PPN31114_00934 [Pandoraea pneumonica]|uniref:Dermonecrotic toxin N-terminal domain-containing protein n=2 Tax=Pandoraea pneumonica TaxID=2508299 RepID=A0A5E4SN88_9BURK|nr:hypothetical protein PPN31114_00934 [Pandoraea pneumonica]